MHQNLLLLAACHADSWARASIQIMQGNCVLSPDNDDNYRKISLLCVTIYFEVFFVQVSGVKFSTTVAYVNAWQNVLISLTCFTQLTQAAPNFPECS